MTFEELNESAESLWGLADRTSVPEHAMPFDELMELTRPYRMFETIAGLGKAKIIIDEYSDAHPEAFTREEIVKLHRISNWLLIDIGNLASKLPDVPGFPNEDENDGIPTLVIPAGEGSIPYWRNP